MTQNFIPFMAATAVTGSTEAASRLIESQSIGLPAAIGIATTVFIAARWLERRFTRLEDRLENLPCQQVKPPKCEKDKA